MITRTNPYHAINMLMKNDGMKSEPETQAKERGATKTKTL